MDKFDRNPQIGVSCAQPGLQVAECTSSFATPGVVVETSSSSSLTMLTLSNKHYGTADFISGPSSPLTVQFRILPWRLFLELFPPMPSMFIPWDSLLWTSCPLPFSNISPHTFCQYRWHNAMNAVDVKPNNVHLLRSLPKSLLSITRCCRLSFQPSKSQRLIVDWRPRSTN